MTLSKLEMDSVARNGVIEWAEAIVRQSAAIRNAFNQRMKGEQEGFIALHVAEHFFVIAAHRFFQFVDLARERAVISAEVLSGVEQYRKDARDLRNMREHVIEYLKGHGKFQDEFRYLDPESMERYGREIATLASQSTFIGGVYKLGGRLDVFAFADGLKSVLANFRRDASK